MKTNSIKNLTKTLSILFFIGLSFGVYGQEGAQKQQKSDFWDHVQFGGGFGLSTGSGFTDVTVAPSAIYNFNSYIWELGYKEASFLKKITTLLQFMAPIL
jgi:hypothetical protein